MTFVSRLSLTCFVCLIARGPAAAQTTAQANGNEPDPPHRLSVRDVRRSIVHRSTPRRSTNSRGSTHSTSRAAT